MKNVKFWLYGVCFMVWSMAIIGAITRLTESGLSITEWKPITGVLPPLNDADWQAEFTKYQQTPEFKVEHSWMGIDDFKEIYFWEWLHRLWGRLIGLAFALPLAFFWVTGRLPEQTKKPLLGILALGALQGFVGWWMVQSGLSDRVDVSHFRLATHLSLALVIFSACWWVALGLSRIKPLEKPKGVTVLGVHALAFLALTIVWGAFTAGLDAGKIYGSWPFMGGQFLPPESFYGLSDLFSSPAFVQFTHRWMGFITGIVLIAFAVKTRSGVLAVLTLIQITLGIGTLQTGVNLHMATAHQANGILLLASTLYTLYRLKIPKSG